jgi:hypothetical protein
MSEEKQKSRLQAKKIITYLILLIFTLSCRLPVVAAPTPEAPTPLSPTAAIEQPTPIPPSPTFEPPAGFREYRDSLAGVSIYLPESWFITGIIEGQYAIFQSYPEDKYVGGEPFQPGDTKCDLNLQIDGSTPQEVLNQWTADGLSTILSQEDVTLTSGLPGLRVELEGWGGSLTMFTTVNDNLIAYTCYGPFEYFNEIAGTIRPIE